MKTRIVLLRKALTISNFRRSLFVFFRETKFESQYVSCFVQLISDDGKQVISIGKTAIFEITNRTECLSYVERATVSFKKFASQSKKSLLFQKMNIHYIETTEEAYKEFLNKAMVSKNYGFESDSSY